MNFKELSNGVLAIIGRGQVATSVGVKDLIPERTDRQEYELIKQKKSKLSAAERARIVTKYEEVK